MEEGAFEMQRFARFADTFLARAQSAKIFGGFRHDVIVQLNYWNNSYMYVNYYKYIKCRKKHVYFHDDTSWWAAADCDVKENLNTGHCIVKKVGNL